MSWGLIFLLGALLAVSTSIYLETKPESGKTKLLIALISILAGILILTSVFLPW